MAELKDVEIFAEGTWIGSAGPMKWTGEDLAEMIKNTNLLIGTGELKPKIKLGHSEDQVAEKNNIMKGQTDGDPALGRLNNFRIKEKNGKQIVITDFYSVPDIVYGCLEKELYTDVSAELEFVKGFGWFITAVALLGADIPAVKGLADLQAFLSDCSHEKNQGNIQLCFSKPKFNGGNMSDTTDKKNTAPIADPNVGKLLDENKTLQQKYSDKDAELERVKRESADKEAMLKKYQKDALERKFSEQKQTILNPYKKDVDDKKLMPFLYDKIEQCLDSQRENFTENSPLFISPELAREVAQAYIEGKNVGGEQGQGGGSYNGNGGGEMAIDEVIERECKIIQAQNPHMSYSDAAKHLTAIKPELWHEYREWTDKVSALGKVKMA